MKLRIHLSKLNIDDKFAETLSVFAPGETMSPNSNIASQFSNVLVFNRYIKQRCDISLQKFSVHPNPIVKKWLLKSILGRISALSINELLNVNLKYINDEFVCDYFVFDSIQQWLTSKPYILFVEYDVEQFLISDLFMRSFLNSRLEEIEIARESLVLCKNKLVIK